MKEQPMMFGVLGPLQVRCIRGEVTIGSPKERALLGLLLLERGRVVSVDRLADELWGDHPPSEPAAAVRVLVSRLRRTLTTAGLGDRIHSVPPGYLIAVEAGEFDLSEYEELVRKGSALLQAGNHQRAAESLGHALALWRGDVLADVEAAAVLAPMASRLDAERITAIELRIEADMGGDFDETVVSELEVLVEQTPLRETLWIKLLLALARRGRRGEVRHRSVEFREVLAAVGLEPSPAFLEAEAEALAQKRDADTVPRRAAAQVSMPRALLRGGDSGLVGREVELAQLSAFYHEVRNGDSMTVLVTGEPGVGKTSLVREVASTCHRSGATVLYGSCDEQLDIGYQPFREILQGYLGAVDEPTAHRVLEGWPHLNALAGPNRRRLNPTFDPLDAERELVLLLEAVEGWMRELTHERPVVLVLDDIHWAGQATMRMVRHLSHHREFPMLLLLTLRDTEAAIPAGLTELLVDVHRRPNIRRLPLSGLDPDGITQLVDMRNASAIWSDGLRTAARIYEETGGNPLFATQLIGHLLESDDALTGASDALQLPGGVRDVIRHRVERLSADAIDVLRAASTIGTLSPFTVLAAVLADSEPGRLLDAVEEAVTARLLVETPEAEFAFVHALVSRTIYDGMSTVRRLEIHRAVVRALLESPAALPNHVVLLAHHGCLAAGPGDGAQAGAYCLAAGLEEFDRASFESAVLHFERGIEVLERCGPADPDLESDLWCGVAEVCLRTYDLNQRDLAAWRAVDAARTSGSSERLGRAAYAVARNGVVGVLDDRVIALCEEALQGLGSAPSPTRANLASSLATLQSYAGEGPVAQSTAAEAVQIARAVGDPVVLMVALRAQVVALAGHPDIGLRLSTAEEVFAVAERRNTDPTMLGYAHSARALPRLITGDRDGFERDFAAMGALAHKNADGYLRALTSQWQAAVALLDGRFSEVEQPAGEAIALANDDPNFVNGWAAQLMWLRHEQGRLAEVLPLIEATVVDNSGIVAFRAGLAFAHAMTGSAEAAGEHLQEVLRHSARLPHDWLRTCTLALCAEAVAALGDVTMVVALEDLLAPYAGQLVVVATGTHCQGAIDRYRGMLAFIRGDYASAERLLSAALILEEEARAVTNAARTRTWYARTLLTRRDRTGLAEELAQDALATASRLGMPEVLASAQGLLAKGSHAPLSPAKS